MSSTHNAASLLLLGESKKALKTDIIWNLQLLLLPEKNPVIQEQEGWVRGERMATVNSHTGDGIKGQGALLRTFSHSRTATVCEWRQVLSTARALLPRILASRDTQSNNVNLSRLPIVPSSHRLIQLLSPNILLSACHSAPGTH